MSKYSFWNYLENEDFLKMLRNLWFPLSGLKSGSHEDEAWLICIINDAMMPGARDCGEQKTAACLIKTRLTDRFT